MVLYHIPLLLKRKTFPAVKHFALGILALKGGNVMQMRSWAITLGLGAAAGAVAILMMPRNNPARKLAAQAASKVEDAACKVGSKLSQAVDM